MKKISDFLVGFFGSFILLALAGTANAGPTGIASVPLLNINGTGSVRPNMMLLYDNSGSMAWSFTPDYVGNSASTCRTKSTLASGQRACMPGDPPYNSPDFNKQYYNPAIRYVPPVRADGTSYTSQTRSATTNWTAVAIDGFGVTMTDIFGGSASGTTINLATKFPDLAWCSTSSSASCTGYNTASYVYPNDTYNRVTYDRYGNMTQPLVVGSNPYYYTINVAEYCTDDTLTNCVTTALNASAPAGYPSPAKVRWCNSPNLDTGNGHACQAKYTDDAFFYPRFSNPTISGVAAYGTIAVGVSSSANSLTINSVTLNDPSGAVVITNAAATAASGTNTSDKQVVEATDLAYQIVQKTGLAKSYTACVVTPSGANAARINNCAYYGITLGANNIVAVIPLDCVAGASSKAIGPCQTLSDASQSGFTMSVSTTSVVTTAAVPSTALITVSGSAANSTNSPSSISSVTLGGTALLSSKLTFAKSAASDAVAKAIAGAIGTVGTVTAYQGGNTITNTCKNASTSVVCLVDTSLANGQTPSVGAIANNNNLSFGTSNSTGGANAKNDSIPISLTPLGAGAALFVRTDIVSGVTSYPRAANRTDCAGATCSYDEEMTNFANWYAYYRTRNQMMKTAVGLAFQALNSNYNVGIVSLADAAAGNAMTTPKQFTGSARTNWYSTLYAMAVGGATPMRLALNAVGQMYADPKQNVVQYPCQQNFTLITTDGYWNGGPATNVADNDNTENADRFCTQSSGCVDARVENPASLADVGLYWYNGGSSTGVSSLRADLEDMTKQGSVPAASGDNTHLHMNTYALGLGVDGIMKFDPNYKSPAAGSDFYRLIHNVQSGCPWNSGGAYVWPDPQTTINTGSASIQARVDDLWHTAINGHGAYFSAADPTAVVTSLTLALSNIQGHLGAASAAATSTPNISLADNDIFSATFTTVSWFGEITDRKIDPVTGVVGSAVTWSSSNTLGALVTTDSSGNDARTIYMLDTANPGTLKPFLYANMTSTEQGWFSGKCSLLSQCPTLSTADKAIVDNGDTIVDWLRGQQRYADGTRLRAYTANTAGGAPMPVVLGDVASAKPAYQRDPRKGYLFDAYGTFRATNAARKAAVFVAANDGMLHAFDAANGNEMWAYAPRITMKKLYAQASTTYGTNHQFTTDGSPEIGDVEINGQWRSVLVAGLNGGGRGYYAIDVTDPANPQALWETCADTTVCSGNNVLQNLGLSFGNPQFGTWKDAAGTVHWVVFVTSGYNNLSGTDGVASGDGHGYLYVLDVATGQPLTTATTGTAVGDTSTPSGLAKITAITANPNSDPLVTAVYGGDNLGNMWRFDFSRPGPAPAPVLMGSAGSGQPITSRPDVTMCAVTTVDAQQNSTTAPQKFVAFGTGRMLDVPDLNNTTLQSVYVLKDTGTGISATDWRSSSKMADRQLAKTTTNKLDTYTISGPTVNLGTQLGWFFDLDQNSGERVNLDPKVVSGTLNVVTNIPSTAAACLVGGTANVYELNVCSGTPVMIDDATSTSIPIAGRTLSNSSAAVGFIVVRLPSGALKMITTTADGATLTTGVAAAKSIAPHRAGWREVHE